MPSYIIYLGVAFWAVAVFFGCRRKFATALPSPLQSLRDVIGVAGLSIIGALLLAAAFALAHQQAQDIANQIGVIGPYFALAVLCGVGGAVFIAAGTSKP